MVSKRKKLYPLILILVCFLSSCVVQQRSQRTKTYRKTDILTQTFQADLTIDQSKKHYSAAATTSHPLENIKSDAISKILEENEADVLISPTYVVETNGTRVTVTVSGFTAVYSGLRLVLAEGSSVQPIRPAVSIPKTERIVVSTPQAASTNTPVVSKTIVENERNSEREEAKSISKQSTSTVAATADAEKITEAVVASTIKEVESTNVAVATQTKATTEKTIVPENRYQGDMKNGAPHGLGIMYFNIRTKVGEVTAENGDYISGKWKNGALEYGTLYDANGKEKAKIVIGR